MDPTSAHPRSLINSIPFSQALRLKKICSETSELDKHLGELKESFINRGCRENFQFNRILEATREALLTSKPKTANKPRIPLVLKFNRTLQKFNRTLGLFDKHWHLLQINPKLKNAF